MIRAFASLFISAGSDKSYLIAAPPGTALLASPFAATSKKSFAFLDSLRYIRQSCQGAQHRGAREDDAA